MNAFAAARGDKSAMRPFAKLFWTLVFAKYRLFCAIKIICAFACCFISVFIIHSWLNRSVTEEWSRDNMTVSRPIRPICCRHRIKQCIITNGDA